MSDLQNTSFETPGASAGLADSWALFTHSNRLIAAFGGDSPWDTFETGWSNDGYLYTLPEGDHFTDSFLAADYVYGLTGDVALFNTGANPFESFEVAWSNNNYLYDFRSTSPAAFDSGGTPENFEDFEDLWVTGYLYSLSGTSAAAFGVPAARESGSAETFALADAETLTVSIDGGSAQTVNFAATSFANIAAATAEEVADAINATPLVGATASATSSGTKVTITSSKAGTLSHVHVTGGTANGALGFSTVQVDGSTNAYENFEVGWATMTTI